MPSCRNHLGRTRGRGRRSFPPIHEGPGSGSSHARACACTPAARPDAGMPYNGDASTSTIDSQGRFPRSAWTQASSSRGRRHDVARSHSRSRLAASALTLATQAPALDGGCRTNPLRGDLRRSPASLEIEPHLGLADADPRANGRFSASRARLRPRVVTPPRRV